MKINSDIKQNNVDYMEQEIKHIITTFGDRDPGSDGERNALDYMAGELTKYSDTVVQEKFSVHPDSFYGWMPFTGVVLMVAVVAAVFLPLLSLILGVIAIIPMLSQFIFYTPLFDFLYKKKVSGNILAVKKPQGEVKRRIVLNGHSDAAHEWHWHYVGGFKLMMMIIFVPLIGLAYVLALSITGVAIVGVGSATEELRIAAYVATAFIPFFVGLCMFNNIRRVVPGANDNLSACYMAIGAMKTLQEAGVALENTELCCLITGSEEAGLRGAKAWSKRHKDFGSDVETIFVTYETLRELEHLVIYSRDMNSLVANDKEVCGLIKRAGQKNDMELNYGSVFCGATDSAAFSMAGFKSTAIAGMAPNIKKYYHTRLDNYDNLSKDCLSKVLDITIDALNSYDKIGLSEQ